tara:strand:- start:485 stop:871 length:387 start_codon:yes stop_codon:yes gene_type:complete
MKITKSRLSEIIKEALQEAEVEAPSYKKAKKSSKKDLGPSAHACEAEQTDVVVAGLKEILEKWEESEYESDEARWQEYAKDIQGFIADHGDEAEATPQKEKKKASKSKSEKAPSSPKSKAPKLAKMTY